MSHEGLRIISAEEAKREAEQAARPVPPEAVTPAKIRVKKTEGTGMEIDWRDGHQSSWSFRCLRDACPCATCHEEREANGRAPGEPKPKPQAVFAMYEAPPRPREVTPIGKYALNFKWEDGHTAGIYSWEYLRRLCQCESCRKG